MRFEIDCGRATRMVFLATLIAFSTSARRSGRPGERDGRRSRGEAGGGAKVWAAKLGFMEPLESLEATADGSGAFAIEAGPGRLGGLRRPG